MPSVTASPSTKVLVTGANGFAAIWLVKTLLEKGYTVIGTVRSPSKASFLKEKFKYFGEKLEIAVVEDIAQMGAFDELVKDVDAIEHTASPFHFNAKDLEEFRIPAVQGTVGILESALKFGTKVKRVVLTSSGAAIAPAVPPHPTVYTEKDWYQPAEKSVNGSDIYRASKVLAERAAWDFYEENKNHMSWDLNVINPVGIFGPLIHEVSSPKESNLSCAMWYDAIVKGSKGTREELSEGASRVDVRDLAQAFVLALETEAAGGERLIVSAGPFIWQDWLNAINGLEPPPSKHVISKGFPELSNEYPYPVYYDSSKAARILGVRYRPIEETATDILQDFETRGW